MVPVMIAGAGDLSAPGSEFPQRVLTLPPG